MQLGHPEDRLGAGPEIGRSRGRRIGGARARSLRQAQGERSCPREALERPSSAPSPPAASHVGSGVRPLPPPAPGALPDSKAEETFTFSVVTSSPCSTSELPS